MKTIDPHITIDALTKSFIYYHITIWNMQGYLQKITE